MIAYVIAGLVAGLSGALYPMLRGFVSPELLSFSASGNAVVSVLIGGVGTLVGALYGSVILVVIKSLLGSWTEHHLIVVGALFVASILFLPRGLIGVFHTRLPVRVPKSPATVSRSVPVSQEAN